MKKKEEAIFMEGFYSGMWLCLKGLKLDIIQDPNKDAYDYVVELQEKYHKNPLDRIMWDAFKDWSRIDLKYLNGIRKDIIKGTQTFTPDANFANYLTKIIEQINKEIADEKSVISVDEIEAKFKEVTE